MTAGQRLDKNKIRRSFAAAAGSYDELAALQRRVGIELLQKYPAEAGGEGFVLDIGCGTGFLTRQLAASIVAPLLALDIALPMLQASRQKQPGLPVQYLCADAERLPLADAGIGQIYSNLALQWCQDSPTVFADCRRILRDGGTLSFSTFGPATLRELKAAWAAVDDFAHVNEFYAVEQIRRFLQEAGFQAIEVDSVMHRCRYPSVMALMHELKGIGAHNVSLARNRKPTTRSQLQAMIEAYPVDAETGDYFAGYEIIFVHARK